MAIKKVSVDDLNKIEGGDLTPRRETRVENRSRTRDFQRRNTSGDTTGSDTSGTTGSESTGTETAPEGSGSN